MHTLRDQRGMGLILEIILGAIVLAVLGGAVYAVLRHQPLSDSRLSVPAEVKLNPKCEYNDPELCRFVNNWQVQANYTAKTTEKSSTGTSETTMQLEGDKKYHLTTAVNGKVSMDTIGLDNTTYTKDFSDKKWWKQTVDSSKDVDNPGERFDFNNKNKDNDTQAAKTEYKAAGKTACGKLQCFKYQVIVAGDTGTTFILFDDHDYLLRQMSRTATDGSYTTDFSYDKNHITAPSPTKDAAPGQMILPTGEAVAPPAAQQ